MRKGATFSKSILLSIFNRRGGTGHHTMPFDILSSRQKKQILEDISLGSMEEPVIASLRADDCWVLITTERVIYYRAGTLTYIENTDIKDVTVDLLADSKRGARTKGELVYLRVFTHSGNEYLIEIEAGPPHIGIWNVLKHIAARRES